MSKIVTALSFSLTNALNDAAKKPAKVERLNEFMDRVNEGSVSYQAIVSMNDVHMITQLHSVTDTLYGFSVVLKDKNKTGSHTKTTVFIQDDFTVGYTGPRYTVVSKNTHTGTLDAAYEPRLVQDVVKAAQRGKMSTKLTAYAHALYERGMFTADELKIPSLMWLSPAKPAKPTKPAKPATQNAAD